MATFSLAVLDAFIASLIATDGDLGVDSGYSLVWFSNGTVGNGGNLPWSPGFDPASVVGEEKDHLLVTGRFDLYQTHQWPSGRSSYFYVLDPTWVYIDSLTGQYVPNSDIPTPDDDTSWFDADRFVDPRDAPSAYFETGAFDAQHGVRVPKKVDALYQKNYDEGFAFGSQLDVYLSRESM